jgi:hypothetical protein
VFSVVVSLAAAVLPACHAPQFTLVRDPLLSEATGQHSLVVRATNRGTHACRVRGFPTVTLEDRAGPIPFVISHDGDQMVTNKPPVTVVVRPRHAAFVLLNNYRCDLGDRRTVNVVRIGVTASQMTALLIIGRYRKLHWCGKGDAGSTLAVSPFEPSLGATLRHG